MNQIANQQRIGTFDLLRFLAAATVVCMHHGAWDVIALNSPLHADQWLADIVKYGKFGVDVFFIISGYFVFLTADGRGWKDFAIARLSRIYPALFVFCTVSFIIISLWGALPGGQTPNWKNYIGNVTLISFVTSFLPGFSGAGYVEGVYWTLAYEFVWYALVAVFLMRGTVDTSQRFLGILSLMSIALWCVLYLGVNERIGQIGQYLPYFVLGAQMYLMAKKPATPLGIGVFAVNAILVGISVYFRAAGGLVNHPTGLEYSAAVSLILVGASIVVMFAAANGKLRIGGSLVTALGASTYPLYLMHDKVGVVIAQHVSWLRGAPGLLILLLFFVLVAVGFALYIEPHLIRWMKSGLRTLLRVKTPGIDVRKAS